MAEEQESALQQLAQAIAVELKDGNRKVLIEGFSETVLKKACPLSPREHEALVLVSHGYTNKSVGRVMGISEQTVKNYLTSIITKIGGQDRTHCVAIALCNGWIPADVEGDLTYGIQNSQV